MTGMEFLIAVAISATLSMAVYMLAPKPKARTTSTARDLDMPTVSAGRPIPVVFGDMTVKSPNVLWYGDKLIHEYKVKV